MSTATPQPALTSKTDKQDIVIVSHSSMFYWWPVWALGFLFFLLSYFGHHRMALVPDGTVAEQKRKVEHLPEPRDLLIVPADRSLPVDPHNNDKPLEPYVRMSSSKNYGVVFIVTLFVVVLITNVPLRGLWSVLVLVLLFFGSILLWALNLWEPILTSLKLLQIYINAAGYLSISVLFFGLWLITFLFFDRQVYMIFTPGQLKVCQEIGGGESTFPTSGINFQKQRSDLFRHWILGLGSGDLVVKTSGANQQHFEMHNVLFVGHKVRQIEEMLRDVPVVKG